jgi:hypothetical protein
MTIHIDPVEILTCRFAAALRAAALLLVFQFFNLDHPG